MTASGAPAESTVDVSRPHAKRFRYFRRILLFSLVSLAVLVIAVSSDKPFPEIRARLLGDDLIVDPQSVFLGEVAAGGRASGQFTFKNLSGVPISLLGADVSCQCTVVDDLPCQIPAGESRTISVSLTTAEKDAGKTLAQSARVYFNASRPGQKVTLTVHAKVLADDSTSREL